MWTPIVSGGVARNAREISVRESPSGGGVLLNAMEFPVGLISRARDVVLMIHGFNVNVCNAGCSYDRFNRVAGLKWQSRSVAVYWPGDATSRWASDKINPGRWSAVVSVLSYPLQVSQAQLAAQRLADLIAASRKGSTRQLRLTIVAHSLGCRVALELLLLLRSTVLSGTISVPLTVLMAAAVPRYLILQRQELRPALEVPDRVIVYYSKNDRTLQFAFRPGQALERPFPGGWTLASRTAVGRNGVGLDRPQKVLEKQGTQDHGEYWSDAQIATETSSGFTGRPLSRVTTATRPVCRTLHYRHKEIGRRLHLRPLRSVVRHGCGECVG